MAASERCCIAVQDDVRERLPQDLVAPGAARDDVAKLRRKPLICDPRKIVAHRGLLHVPGRAERGDRRNPLQIGQIRLLATVAGALQPHAFRGQRMDEGRQQAAVRRAAGRRQLLRRATLRRHPARAGWPSSDSHRVAVTMQRPYSPRIEYWWPAKRRVHARRAAVKTGDHPVSSHRFVCCYNGSHNVINPRRSEKSYVHNGISRYLSGGRPGRD